MDINQLFEIKNETEFEKIQTQINDNKKILNDLDDFRTNNIYNNFIDISNNQLLYFMFIFLFTSSLLYYSINININLIFSIVVSLFLLYFLQQKNKSEYTSEIKQLEMKLNSIYPKPNFFHIDSRILEIIYDAKDFQESNPKVFTNLINYIDNFLKIVNDFELDLIDYSNNYDVARDNMYKAINEFDTLFVNLPIYSNDIFYKKFQNLKNKLNLILLNHLKKISVKSNNKFKENVNNKNKPVDFLEPKASNFMIDL